MIKTRVIPCLLLDGRRLLKTVRFEDTRYVGDSINAVRIFNEKFVDEIMILDISASRNGAAPDLDFIEKITSECFIPLCYGGGVTSEEEAGALFGIGVEKVLVNTAAMTDPGGSFPVWQTGSGLKVLWEPSMLKKTWLGNHIIMSRCGKTKTRLSPIDYAKTLQQRGAGELLVNSVERDGIMSGYDIELTHQVSEAVSIPVIACGGAGSMEDFSQATRAGAAAVAAGSLFVFQGKHRAVLINYPSREDLENCFP